jgi:hypothetical protein
MEVKNMNKREKNIWRKKSRRKENRKKNKRIVMNGPNEI